MRNLACRIVLVTVCLGLFVSGCTSLDPREHPILPTPEQRALIEPWPIKVGVFVSPNIDKLQYGRGWRKTPAGKTIDLTFRWGIAQLFGETLPLGRPPGEVAPPEGLAGSIELADVRLRESIPPNPLASLAITYVLRFYSASGTPEETIEIAGKALRIDPKRSGLGLVIMSEENEMQFALRDQTALTMLGVARAAPVQRWLERAGVAERTLRPGNGTPVAPTFAANTLVILPDLEHWEHTDNAHPMGCIGPTLGHMHPALAVSTLEERTRMLFFPWLEPVTAPVGVDALNAFLADPVIHARFRALGIRHLLAYEGGTETNFDSGGIICGAGMGGGGCFGLSWGEKVSEFNVQLFDLDSIEKPIPLHVRESGKTVMPAFILPIPLIPATEGIACEALARAIHQRLFPPALPPTSAE